MSLISKKIVFSCFKKVQGGQFIFSLPDGSNHIFGQLAHDHDTPIQIKINDLKAFSLAISSGDIGVAEGFFKNFWQTDDLEKLLRLVLQNRSFFTQLIYGTWFGSLIYKLKHFLHRNTKAQSKKNIHAHYDLEGQRGRLLERRRAWLLGCTQVDAVCSGEGWRIHRREEPDDRP